MIPYQLQLIVNFLRNLSIQASGAVNGEPRIGSLVDEENIRELILEEPSFKDFVKKPPPRHCGDILVKMNGIWQPVNIKTTIGKSDNATSRAGIVFSFTDLPLEEIPKQIKEKKMWELINKNKKEVKGRDYWYLTLDKNDMSQVRAYGLRQIRHWKSNPSNDLQIHWEKQWEDKSEDLSFDDSYDLVKGKWKEIIAKKINNFDLEILIEVLKKDPKLLNEIMEKEDS